MKQIILLTGNDSEREAQIEQQLRELTLLPLNIKHMSVKVFLQTGAPRGAALIVLLIPCRYRSFHHR